MRLPRLIAMRGLMGAVLVFMTAVQVLIPACASNSPTPAVGELPGWQLDSLDTKAPDDAVVARVEGRPVHASCVAIQASAHGLTTDQALQECIDFELLAIEAHQAGTLTDPDVQAAGKQELVRVFVQERYPVRGPDDLPASLIERLWERIKVPRYNHPELRNIDFCRIPLTAEQGPDSSEYTIAKKFLTDIYEQLRDKRDLKREDLYAPCYDTYEDAGVHEMKLQFTGLLPEDRLQEMFRPSIFGAESAGMVVPPLHSQYGWDLILITQVVPEKATTLAEAEPEIRKALFELPVYEPERDAIFARWYAPFAEARAIEVHPERLPEGAPIPTGVQP